MKSLVYVSALMPDVGESGMSLAARFPSELSTATRSVPYRESGRSGTDLYLKRDKVHQVFAADLPESEANLLGVTQRPVATTAFSEKAKVAAWKSIPSWALVGRQDKTINPEQERFQAKRAGAHTVEINSSHVSLIAHPEAVTDLILQAAGVPPPPNRPWRPPGPCMTPASRPASPVRLVVGTGAVLLGRRLRRRLLTAHRGSATPGGQPMTARSRGVGRPGSHGVSGHPGQVLDASHAEVPGHDHFVPHRHPRAALHSPVSTDAGAPKGDATAAAAARVRDRG